MIWYSEELKLANTPPNTSVMLIGEFNLSSAAIIEIYIVSRHPHTERKLELYTHNPSMMTAEDPSKEDVYNRYAAKIIKLRTKYSNYDDIEKRLS